MSNDWTEKEVLEEEQTQEKIDADTEEADYDSAIPVLSALAGFGLGCASMLLTRKSSSVVQFGMVSALTAAGAGAAFAKGLLDDDREAAKTGKKAVSKEDDKKAQAKSTETKPVAEPEPEPTAEVETEPAAGPEPQPETVVETEPVIEPETSPEPDPFTEAAETVAIPKVPDITLIIPVADATEDHPDEIGQPAVEQIQRTSEFPKVEHRSEKGSEVFSNGKVKSFTAEFGPVVLEEGLPREEKQADEAQDEKTSDDGTIPEDLREALDGLADELQTSIDQHIAEELDFDEFAEDAVDNSDMMEDMQLKEEDVTEERAELIQNYRAIFRNRKKK